MLNRLGLLITIHELLFGYLRLICQCKFIGLMEGKEGIDQVPPFGI